MLAALTHPVHAAVVALYLLALLALGARKARGVRSAEDFSLAGRGLGAAVLTGTLVATWIGTGSLFGNAEKAYQDGTVAFLLAIPGALGILALWWIASRVRRLEQVTIQDVLEARFGVVARLLGTVALVCAYVIIVSYQYRAGAAVLGMLAPELSRPLCIVLVALFVIAYTALAGMVSVARTDVANGLLMILGIAIALPILLVRAGGLDGVAESLDGAGVSSTVWSPLHAVSILLPTILLLLGDANMVQRFFSAKDERAARRAAGWMFVGTCALELAIIATALVGRALVEQGKLAAPENPAHVLLVLAFEALPPIVGALLVATAVAVVVSTADSYLLAPATSVVRDVVQRFVAPKASDRALVLSSRVVVVVLGAIALVMAFGSSGFFEVALFAYTIYGASITPVLLAAYFWRRATPTAAVASMLAGLGGSIGWRWLVEQGALERWASAAGLDALADAAARVRASELDAVLPAVAASTLVLVIVTLLSRRAPDDQRGRAAFSAGDR